MTESWGWNSKAEKNPPESYPRSLGNTSPPLEEFKRYGELIELKAIIKPRPGPASDHIDSTSHKNCINTINLSFYSSTQDDWSLIKNEKTQSKQKQNKKPQPNQTKTKPKPFSRDRAINRNRLRDDLKFGTIWHILWNYYAYYVKLEKKVTNIPN